MDVENVALKLVDIDKELLIKTKMFDNLSDAFMITNKEIQLKHQALEAFAETVAMFREQVKLQEMLQKEAQPHEVKRWVHQFSVLPTSAQEGLERYKYVVEIGKFHLDDRSFVPSLYFSQN